MTYLGLRPGEKLYEEKLMAEEGLKKTKNDLIHIGCPIPFDVEEFLEELDGLLEAAYKNKDDVKERVQKVVARNDVKKFLTLLQERLLRKILIL